MKLADFGKLTEVRTSEMDEEMASMYAALCAGVAVCAAEYAVNVFHVPMRGSSAKSIDEVLAMRCKSLVKVALRPSKEVSSLWRKVMGWLDEGAKGSPGWEVKVSTGLELMMRNN